MFSHGGAKPRTWHSRRSRMNHPDERTGPRPLALHMATAAAVWGGAAAAAAAGPASAFLWHRDLAGEFGRLTVPPEAAGRAALRRLLDFEAAVARYRAHPFRRAAGTESVLAQRGAARLISYGDGERAALVVPSLVNRHYVCDLQDRRSFARWLAARGWRVLLVDWGRPGERERGFDCTGYIAHILEPFACEAARLSSRPPVVIGYCMGGLLALAMALRACVPFAGLALLAVPWDFHGGGPEARQLAVAGSAFAEMIAEGEDMAVDALQTCFYALDPMLTLRKFLAFGTLEPGSEAERIFVELEDWVNDGVPLAAPVARECFAGWYGRNEPARGAWRIDGEPVQPEAATLPAYVVVPAGDRIVSPASALALARALPNAVLRRPRLGHIGLMASKEAARRVWRPLIAWMDRLP